MMFKEFVDRLISFPRRGQIKINFDLNKKIFHLSIPIFSSIPQCVKTYVDARKNSTFRPHTTSFQIENHKVFLIQEIPFELGFQDTLRQEVDHFWKISKKCHQMLSEMAIEEKYKDALHLDTHFEE